MYQPHIFLSLSTALIAATTPLTLAQTTAGAQADRTPACVLQCDQATAIASHNCTTQDQHCQWQCNHKEEILANVTACAERACDDDDAQGGVTDFARIFNEVCRELDVSIPAAGGNGTGNGTGSGVRAEYWGNGNGGSYGGGGGGGGSWRSGAASSVVVDAVLGWMVGGVGCAVALGMMF